MSTTHSFVLSGLLSDNECTKRSDMDFILHTVYPEQQAFPP